MSNKIKQKLKENLLLTVVLLTVLTKVFEWTGQYAVSKQFQIINISHMLFQIFFILAVAIILFIGFNYLKVKKANYLLIPVLAYFIK